MVPGALAAADGGGRVRNIQYLGILVAAGLAAWSWVRFRRGLSRRLDMFVGFAIAGGLLLESLYPPAMDVVARVLTVGNRLNLVFIASIIVLYFLYFSLSSNLARSRRQISELVRAIARTEYLRHRAGRAGKRSITIVIPAYNEEKSILPVLQRIPESIRGYQTHPVVVEDGGTDRTKEVVREMNFPVTAHLINRGQGDALRTGFEIALAEGSDIVITMDADGQHQPEEIEKLIAPIVSGEADFVLGSRFLGEYEDRGGFRHAGILFFTWLTRLLSGAPITDITNGFRAIRTEKILQLELSEDRFNAPELLMEAARKGLRIAEVPVTIKSRFEGESKKPRGLRYPFGFGKTIIKTWLR